MEVICCKFSVIYLFTDLALYSVSKGSFLTLCYLFKIKVNHTILELELFKQIPFSLTVASINKLKFSKLAYRYVFDKERLPSIVTKFHRRLHRYL